MSLQQLQFSVCQKGDGEGFTKYTELSFLHSGEVDIKRHEMGFQIMTPSFHQQKKDWSFLAFEGRDPNMSGGGGEEYFGSEKNEEGFGCFGQGEEENGERLEVGKECENGHSKLCARGHWRPAEDSKLKELVAQHGPQNWNLIAEKLEGRSGNGKWKKEKKKGKKTEKMDWKRLKKNV